MASEEHPVFDSDVEDSRSKACWSVEERAWKQELPHLPDEVIALLATPVVVSASQYHETPPAPAPGYGERMPRFLAPAPPRNARRVGRPVTRNAAWVG
jgi:hypothetical protein